MTANVELRLSGSLDHLRIAWQTGEALLESIPFEEDPEGTRYNVLLAVQEMVTNVLRHAYAGTDAEPVRLSFEASDAGIGVEICDRGPEFNPVEVQCATGSDDFPRTEGGYGIMIAKMVMDDLGYSREAGWNRLRMFKAARSAARCDEPQA